MIVVKFGEKSILYNIIYDTIRYIHFNLFHCKLIECYLFTSKPNSVCCWRNCCNIQLVKRIRIKTFQIHSNNLNSHKKNCLLSYLLVLVYSELEKLYEELSRDCMILSTWSMVKVFRTTWNFLRNRLGRLFSTSNTNCTFGNETTCQKFRVSQF